MALLGVSFRLVTAALDDPIYRQVSASFTRTVLGGMKGKKMNQKSEQQVKQEVDQRLREITAFKEEAQRQGLRFACLSEENLVKKIRGDSSKSPYFYMQGWSGGMPGYSTDFFIYIANPDPIDHDSMFVSIFFGAGNFVDDIGMALAGRDTQWPFLTTARFSLAAGAIIEKTFTYKVPTGIPPSTYIGNAVVWKGQYLDKGFYFDRTLFDVQVR